VFVKVPGAQDEHAEAATAEEVAPAAPNLPGAHGVPPVMLVAALPVT